MAHWIKSDINIDFVGRRSKVWTFSTIAVVVSLSVLVANVFIRGGVLNFGTDFRGGTQVLVDFNKTTASEDVRKALKSGGFNGGEVVGMASSDKPNLYMLRLQEVSSFSAKEQAAAKAAIDKAFPSKLDKFDYEEGGDKLYLKFKKGADLGRSQDTDVKTIKTALVGAGVAIQQVHRFGRAEDKRYEIILGGLGIKLRAAFETGLGAGSVKEIPQMESVGAKMGAQLRDDGIKSVIISLLLMLVYIAIRFDFRYAPGAVVALAHDVIITIGVFGVLWIEFSLPVLAALLTIAGYSINDTIVVYDRIRENVTRLRDRKFALVVNASINETLSRTLLTSVTTLFTCISIWIVGTGVLKTFAIALTIGVFVGTYSSVFIASPLVVVLNERISARKRGGGR
jgi:preprotein translocase subunit SecF